MNAEVSLTLEAAFSSPFLATTNILLPLFGTLLDDDPEVDSGGHNPSYLPSFH